MTSLYSIIRHLQNEPSKNQKVALLVEYDSPLLQQYLNAVYEPRINYFIKKFERPVADIEGVDEFTATDIQNIIDTIAGRKLTGNAARQYLTDIWNRLDEENRMLLEWMIAGDIRAGMSASTINKAFPELITQEVYMRCAGLDAMDKATFFDGRDHYSQTKADGMFANFLIKERTDFEVTSRQGETHPPEFYEHIAADLRKRVTSPTMFFGEMLVREIATGKILPRAEGNGMLNALRQGEGLDGFEVTYVVWDAIPASQFLKKNKYKVPYSKRFANVQALLAGPSAYVSIIETKLVKSWEEAFAHYSEKLAEGQEGTVIKHADGEWADGTSKWQIKLKLVVDVDLRVMGFSIGKGKHAATFGSLQMETCDSLLSVGVSGIPDKLRKEIHENRMDWFGKIVTIKGNAVTVPKEEGGLYSIYLPRFVERRSDKVTADSLAEVIQQFNNAIAGK